MITKAFRPFSVRLILVKGGRAVLVILAVFFICILVLAGILLLISPGKAIPFLNEDGTVLAGSISEKKFLDIGGVRQGLFIKGKDTSNPVLLYLHGGMPDYFLTGRYPTGLEDYFTVAWWEQRGSGLSYSPDIPPETMTLSQMISDTMEVTEYLRHRFGQEKIYLMGHSGGTFIGIQAAQQAPEPYRAYIGVAQISHQLESEVLAYEYMLEQFKTDNNRKMVRKLEAAPLSMSQGIPAAYYRIRDTAMHQLGIGTTHTMRSVISGIFVPSLTCREYTFIEKLNMWRGKAGSGVSVIWGTILTTDLSVDNSEIDIPVYFFEGKFDYTVSTSLAREYFEKINAPVKGFYTFGESAHSPLFEEPERMKEIVQNDVLTGTNRLSDTE